MKNPLPALHQRLLERLPTLENVMVLKEPWNDEEGLAPRIHLTPNVVRVRIELESKELRLGLSGLLSGVHPDIATPEDEEARLAAFTGQRIVIPPLWYQDNAGATQQFQNIKIRNPGSILAISTFDGGLGTINVDRKLHLTHTIPDELLAWNKRVNTVCWAISDELDVLQKAHK